MAFPDLSQNGKRFDKRGRDGIGTAFRRMRRSGSQRTTDDSTVKDRSRRPQAGSAAAARPDRALKTPRAASAPPLPARPLMRREGEKPAERVPVILETAGSDHYRLIDSGMGEKLEQYGPYRIVRPEAQALWPRGLPDAVWDK